MATDDAPAPLAVAPSRPRRLAYLGTPAVAVPPLEALVGAGFDVALAITGPDKRRGRGSALEPSPVKAAAATLGVPVSHQLDEVTDVGADVAVVVAYGRIIPRRILERVAMVNLHFSLLPRWRGAAPVERALLAGDDRTGVCLMELAEGLDTGGVYDCVETPIGSDETLASLRGRLVALGSQLLVTRLTEGLGTPRPQVGEATYAHKIAPSDLVLDWSSTTSALDRQVRLGDAHTTFRDARLKVWRVRPETVGGWAGAAEAEPGTLLAPSDGGRALGVRAADGVLVLEEVQPPGRARQDTAAWRNGVRPEPGERFGS